MRSKNFLLFLLLISSPLCFAEVSVIMHPSNEANLSDEDIRRIFLGKMKSFPGGATILKASLIEETVATEFNEKALKKNSSQLKAYWAKLIFTGKGTPPIELNSAADMLETVSSNRDAIGYIDSASVTSAVKVIATY